MSWIVKTLVKHSQAIFIKKNDIREKNIYTHDIIYISTTRINKSVFIRNYICKKCGLHCAVCKYHESPIYLGMNYSLSSEIYIWTYSCEEAIMKKVLE